MQNVNLLRRDLGTNSIVNWLRLLVQLHNSYLNIVKQQKSTCILAMIFPSCVVAV